MSFSISKKAWSKFISDLRKVDAAATQSIQYYLQEFGFPQSREALEDLIYAAFSISNRFGEAAAALSAEWYDAMAALSGVTVPGALPAPPATMSDVASAIMGTIDSENKELVSGAISRLVKLQGVDTTLQNAIRDGAEVAWIPSGDTCAYCIELASRGWRPASKRQLKNGHAEHVHANCDCSFAVRFDKKSDVAGYADGEDAKIILENSPLNEGEADTRKNRLNAVRRRLYAENREKILAQKRSAYEKSKELESSAAEEMDI